MSHFRTLRRIFTFVTKFSWSFFFLSLLSLTMKHLKVLPIKRGKRLSISKGEKYEREIVKSDLTQHNVGKYVQQIPTETKRYRASACGGLFNKFLTFVILDFQWKLHSRTRRLMKKKTEVIVTHIDFTRKMFFLPEISTSILKRGKKVWKILREKIIEKFYSKTFSHTAHIKVNK